jgi:hypothetical protein
MNQPKVTAEGSSSAGRRAIHISINEHKEALINEPKGFKER